uniref:TNFR-Cys domain-containing protein n=1 Tax=Branchiostoma floridae TaxID=7739 RepID=C3YC76_BRAFL|eukprot:XP_002606098.1 hypothetical protein BRAFLDRAFT_88008 [Branchiostoma floridae]
MKVDHSLTTLKEEVRHTRDDIRLRHDGYFWLGSRYESGPECDVAMVMVNGELYDIEAGSGRTKTSPEVTRGVQIVDDEDGADLAVFRGDQILPLGAIKPRSQDNDILLKVILCVKLVGTHGLLFAATDSNLASAVLLSYHDNTVEGNVQFRGRQARMDAQSQLIHENSVIAIELLVTKQYLVIRTPEAMFHTKHNLHLSSSDLSSLTEVHVGGTLVESGLPDDIANRGKFVGVVYEVWVNDKHYTLTTMDFADENSVIAIELLVTKQYLVIRTPEAMFHTKHNLHLSSSDLSSLTEVHVGGTLVESGLPDDIANRGKFVGVVYEVWVNDKHYTLTTMDFADVKALTYPVNEDHDMMYLIIFLATVSGAFLVGLVFCLIWCGCQSRWQRRRRPPSIPPNLPKGVKKTTFKKTMNELRSKLKTINRVRRESRIHELEEHDRLIPSDASEGEKHDQTFADFEDGGRLTEEEWGESRVGSLSKMRETPDGAPISPQSSPVATPKKTDSIALAMDINDGSKRPTLGHTETKSLVSVLSSHSRDVAQESNAFEAMGEKQATMKTEADSERRMSVLMSPAPFHRPSAISSNVISSVEKPARLEQISRTSTNVKLSRSFISNLSTGPKVSKLSIGESETALIPRLSLSDTTRLSIERCTGTSSKRTTRPSVCSKCSRPSFSSKYIRPSFFSKCTGTSSKRTTRTSYSKCSRPSPCSKCSWPSSCSKCSRPSICSKCSRPSSCSKCSRPSICSKCSRPSSCSKCSRPSICSKCSRPSPCSKCSGPSFCSKCSGPSFYSKCSGPSFCSKCTRTSTCSKCSGPSFCSKYTRPSSCSKCSGPSSCSKCSGPSSCSKCSGPSFCSKCYGPSFCSKCSRTSTSPTTSTLSRTWFRTFATAVIYSDYVVLSHCRLCLTGQACF